MSNGDNQVIDYTVGDAKKLSKIDDMVREWGWLKRFGYATMSTVIVTCIAAVVNMFWGKV